MRKQKAVLLSISLFVCCGQKREGGEGGIVLVKLF